MAVLITGASAGFGAAMCRRFVTAGYQVIGAARRADKLAQLQQELGAAFYPLSMDVADKASVDAALASLPPQWADIDLLVNNAGLALGLEAASRGADFVLLNEFNRSAYTQLQKSVALLKSRQGGEHLQCEVRQQDALTLLKNWQGQAFDLIFLDPPFGQEALYLQALSAISAAKLAQTAIYLEANRQWQSAEIASLGWQVAKHSKVGAVHGHLLRPGVQGAA